jgi:hypothetical protein
VRFIYLLLALILITSLGCVGKESAPIDENRIESPLPTTTSSPTTKSPQHSPSPTMEVPTTAPPTITSPTPTPTIENVSTQGKALFEEKCSICHTLDRPRSKRKTYDEWLTTVLRMKNQREAPIDDSEVETITEFLSANYGQ